MAGERLPGEWRYGDVGGFGGYAAGQLSLPDPGVMTMAGSEDGHLTGDRQQRGC